MRKIRPTAGSLALTLMLAACGTGSGEEATADRRSDEGPVTTASQDDRDADYVAIEVMDGGAVRGVVRFNGDVPPARTVPVTMDTATCGSARRVQPLVVGPHGGLADAVVSLADVRRGAAFAPEAPATLDQRDCRFTPHVLLAPVTGSVRVLNSDPLTHNVHLAAFDNRSVNRTQPPGLEAIELRLNVPEKVRVKCDLHPWMGAWIVMAEHPYHAITDEAGVFALADIPPGTYTLEVWHETLGTRRRAVTVPAGDAVDLTLELTADD